MPVELSFRVDRRVDRGRHRDPLCVGFTDERREIACPTRRGILVDSHVKEGAVS
jgi:hypothetical protein